MKKKGFTLIELLVVISIIAMLLAILMPALSKVKKIAQRVVCATNLKGLGTAQAVYSQDYDDEFSVAGDGKTMGAWETVTTQWQKAAKEWADGDQLTIGASLYLLVREADVSPKSFVCPAGDETEYDGSNTQDPPLDIVQLFDFGGGTDVTGGYAYEHVSYAYQMPYGSDGRKCSNAADGTANASFAFMADKNPWFDPKFEDQGEDLADAQTWTDYVGRIGRYYGDTAQCTESSWKTKIANSYSHSREGQNVVYVDGHATFASLMDVGVANDAIYLPRGPDGVDPEAQIRRGDDPRVKGQERDWDIQPRGPSDSYLVNDDWFDRGK